MKIYTKRNIMNSTILSESGRSMVEMLGVLAIIGVLSIGGIAGYTTAMNNHRANQVVSTAIRLATLAANKRSSNPEAILEEDELVDGFEMGEEDENIVLFVSGVSDAVRAKIENMDIKEAELTEDSGDLVFIFDNDLSSCSESWQRKKNGECVCDPKRVRNSDCPFFVDCIDSDKITCYGDANKTADVSCREGKLYCDYGCFAADTLITLADGTCKRVDEITYDDELLVWNFDEGRFDKAKPLWIKVPEVAPRYNYLKFSDGSVLKTIDQHRIFNREAGKFTYPMTEDTPLGTTTLNAKGEWVTLVEKRIVEEEVTYYNIITYHHINCFAGNVLTSCRFNNLYPIQDLKFVKDNRALVPYSEYGELPFKWYEGLRLAEQPKEVNRNNDVPHAGSIVEHIQHMYIDLAQSQNSMEN